MDTRSRVAAISAHRNRRFGLTSRQLNLVIEVLFVSLVATGLASWLLPLDQAWVATTIHGIAGFMLFAVVPLKVLGPVRTGFRRRRLSRWLSATFGVMVLAVLVIGVLHANGIWWGYGYWTGMWTHLLLGFSSIPLFLWHVVSRPSKSARPKRVDVDRRSLLTTSTLLAAGVGAWGTQEVVLKAVGADAADRAGTGSHEIASFDPDAMPRMIWIDDKRPKIDFDTWELRVEGKVVALDDLWAMSKPVVAWLDCTDGWRSRQNWDVVPLSDLISNERARSIQVTSATGYRRLFPLSSASSVYLCVGYDGRRLHGGHGAPVRIVAPNRRGPWWIKWVTDVELSDRPAWMQLPLPGPSFGAGSSSKGAES